MLKFANCANDLFGGNNDLFGGNNDLFGGNVISGISSHTLKFHVL